MEYTINVDVLNMHPKLTESINVVNRLVNTLKKYADSEKVANNVITYKDETIAFIQALNTAIDNYKVTCTATEQQSYKDIDIVKLKEEYDVLEVRLIELEADESINDIGQVEQYKKDKLRKVALQTLYQKLVVAGYNPSV